ncbi:sugar transferase [Treponema primitia ZAS-2]|uniref:Sugar transferase n=1 Tax=Treponema primitia (strain ATCC BAA-887 / DSM 12427 / ZAS-2) TaxID=545694 RepID=F5YNZ7_TREPZ|nr:sugar transferase [Treponema primitia]AEF85240.1 sugar transferase [Treponema primitia ZAS-2]
MIRFFDILFSGIAIIILLPFMIPIVIGLKLTGEHYIFYEQIRVGRHSKDFRLLKFATMLKNSPNLPGGLYTNVNDPRMLPMGKFLRKTKINELPQLINIFLGQMSIVGYRPTVREHYNAYPEYAKQKLYYSKPGLTGMGSIIFRNEEEILQKFEDKKNFHQNVIIPYKALLESWYIDKRNLVNYFKIIIITVIVVLKSTNDSWKKSFRDIPSPPPELQPYI